MSSRIARVVLATVTALSTVLVNASPAHAYTTKTSAWWNDRPVAKVWFNSGAHRPDLGRNSFTLKAEEGTTMASVYYEIPSRPGSGTIVTVYGSGSERTWSVSGPVNPDVLIWYQVCGKVEGRSYCSPQQRDMVR